MTTPADMKKARPTAHKFCAHWFGGCHPIEGVHERWCRELTETLAAALAAEREACAEIVDRHSPMLEVGAGSHIMLAKKFAAEIRARDK